MAFFRRLWSIIAGDRDQPEIAATRNADGVRLRLPVRGHDREVWTPWLIGTMLLGPVLIGTVIHAALNMPPEEHNFFGTIMCLIAMICAMAGVAWKWRVTWYYEVLITPTQLIVNYFATQQHFQVVALERAKIQQFTIASYSNLSELQAECDDDLLWQLVRDPRQEVLLSLTKLINEECVSPGAQVPVKIETPWEIRGERAEPPLNSKIVLTQTETGVTLDFPMPEDVRISLRRRAWKLFEVGLYLLIGVVIAYALLTMLQWRDPLPFLSIPFLIGLICLMIAASHASTSWTGAGGDGDLRQLGVAGNLLIRTTRDHNKRIWYDHEISRIEVERDFTEDGPDWLALKLHTHAKESITLYGPFGDDSRSDYRRKAMLEWVATVLRHALDRAKLESPPAPPPAIEESILQSIQDRAARPVDSHITH